MIPYTTISLTIDEKVVKKIKDILRGERISLSKFTEALYKAALDSDAMPMKLVYQDLAKTLTGQGKNK
jgi:antitoxin component of RelBE/YafQ-DinJ toxin-antitoxin module